MDFHSLTRRELQSLCKLNKIPANITNVAMADALQSLEIVKGIEEFMNVSEPETTDLVESVEQVEASPNTRCRTSTRHKVKISEPENLPPNAARATRRGSKQSAGEVEESNNKILKTPAISTTRRKAPATLSHQNVNSRLNECEDEAKEVKKHGTRRSSRLTEKKSTEPRVKKESQKAVKIDSFFDEVNTEDNSVGSGSTNAEVEEICNALEKLDVVIVNEEAKNNSGEEKQDWGEINILNQESTNASSDSNSYEAEEVMDEEAKHPIVEEKQDCGEINILKTDSDETSNPFDVEKLKMGEKDDEVSDDKPETEVISSPSEFDNSEQKIYLEEPILDDNLTADNDNGLVMIQEENSDLNDISSPFQDENLEQKIDLKEDPLIASEGNNLSAVKEHNLVMVEEKHSDFLLDNNACLESGTKDSIASQELQHKHYNVEEKFDVGEETFDASECNNNMFPVKEQNQVLESNGSSTMIIDMIIDDTENPVESSDSNNEITTKDMEQVSETLIPTVDLMPQLFTENNVEEKCDVGEETFDASECNNNTSPVKEQNQVLESNGSSTMVIDMIIDNTENPVESSDSNNEITTKDMEQVSETLIPTVDHMPELFTENNVEEKFDVGEETFDASECNNNMSPVKEQNQVLESNGTKELQHKDGIFEENFDVGVETFGASELKNNFSAVKEHKQVSETNAVAGTKDSIASQDLQNEDENSEEDFDAEEETFDFEWNRDLSAVKEQNQVPESIGSSDSKNEITTEDMEQVPKTLIPTADLMPEIFTDNNVNEKADAADCGEITNVSEEKDQFCVFSAASLMKKATPLKNMRIVSDDKENMEANGRKLQVGFVDEGKMCKKEKDENEKLNNLNDISLRQLRKQLKALTLKNIDGSKEEGVKTRPALQALCENQLVGGETKN